MLLNVILQQSPWWFSINAFAQLCMIWYFILLCILLWWKKRHFVPLRICHFLLFISHVGSINFRFAVLHFISRSWGEKVHFSYACKTFHGSISAFCSHEWWSSIFWYTHLFRHYLFLTIFTTWNVHWQVVSQKRIFHKICTYIFSIVSIMRKRMATILNMCYYKDLQKGKY